jgi:hypothetical protein
VEQCVNVPKTECHVETRQVEDEVCVDKPETTCNTVEVEVPETVCTPKPVTNCVTVNVDVPETECVDKAVTNCVDVPKQVSYLEPVETCNQVATPVCHTVKNKVPRTVCESLYKHHAVATHGHAHVHAGYAAGAPVIAKSAAGEGSFSYDTPGSHVSVTRGH